MPFVKEEEMQVKVVERSQQIQIQEQEIERREKLLDSTVSGSAFSAARCASLRCY